MASLERRLRQMEILADTLRREDEEVVGGEVMRRLADEDLSGTNESWRALEEGFAEENRFILERIQRLYEEVANEGLT